MVSFVPIYQFARGYVRNGGISIPQSYLKHSLVPLGAIAAHLPKSGVIWDLGCGEGILTNLVARAKPHCQIVGFDRDTHRLEIAKKNAAHNATFEVRDIFHLPEGMRIDGVIMNDVVHHQPFDQHAMLLANVIRRLRPGGAIIIKEVDRADKADVRMTQYFDSKLYPNDVLCFRTSGDWIALLHRLGVKDLQIQKVRHPWPASRTLIVARRPEDSDLFDERQFIAEFGAARSAADPSTVTVFITGASGFIGRHLALQLLTHGFYGRRVRLLALARDPTTFPPELRAAGAVVVPGDLDDLKRLGSICEAVDYVFHLAAEVKFTHGTDLWRNNLQGTVSLLNALKGHHIKRFVYASTMGAVDRSPTDPCDKPLDESIAPNPLSVYGRTKLQAEQVVVDSGVPYSIVRICWCYGPGMTPDTHVRFLAQGVCDGKLFSFVNFPGQVSIVAVDDLVDALLLVAKRDEAKNQIYYVSDGQAISLGELFRRIGNIVSRRAAMIGIPKFVSMVARRVRRFLPLQLQNLNSDVLLVDCGKLVRLGFKPRIKQRQALADLIQDLGSRIMSKRQRISLITGAASGIGLALAEQLSRHGHRLVLIDHNGVALRRVAERLHAEIIEVDLANEASLDIIERYLDDQGFQLDWVINCAGIGVRGIVGEADSGREDQVLQVNVGAVVRLSRLALRHFMAESNGTLINIASSAGFQPMPFMAVYAASKAFVQSYTRSLIGEFRQHRNIHIMLINPSGTQTAFQASSGVQTNPGESLLSPENVAHEIVSSVYLRRREVTIGRMGKAMKFLARVLPTGLRKSK